MRTNWIAATLLFLGGLAGSAMADDAAETEAVVMVGNVSYVSGGVGEDSRERLKAFASAFNLKLVLARKSGEYLGDVQVRIVDGKGAELLQATAEGPIFMANLPPGSYEVAATTEGLTQKQRVAVARGKLGTLHFRWP